MATPPVDRIVALVRWQYPDARNMGVWNRRKIAGTNTWSQHAWGNAYDIGWPAGKGSAYLDLVYQSLRYWKAQGEPIGTILWRVKDHHDHIHVEGLPKMRGIPPESGGSDDDVNVTELVKEIQEALRAEGYVGGNGQALVPDGVWGPQTRFAFQVALRAGGLSRGSTFSAKVL